MRTVESSPFANTVPIAEGGGERNIPTPTRGDDCGLHSTAYAHTRDRRNNDNGNHIALNKNKKVVNAHANIHEHPKCHSDDVALNGNVVGSDDDDGSVSDER